MLILGIETSCDETAAAIVKNGTEVLSSVVASSEEIHQKYGGIIPEQAAREQIRSIIPVIEEALEKSKVKSQKLEVQIKNKQSLFSHKLENKKYQNCVDAIAVTVGPGLIGSLLVGVETAKTLAWMWNKPIVPVNHLIAHIYANFLQKPDEPGSKEKTSQARQPCFPTICLVVSGGHTELVLMKNHGKFDWLGGTRDDAAGECFDKCSRLLGLGYPGGPAIETAASNLQRSLLNKGDSLTEKFKLPRPMINEDNFDFSFSGLKTAVLQILKTLKTQEPVIKEKNNLTGPCCDRMSGRLTKELLAYEIQEAITDVLVEKTMRAAKKYQVTSVLIGGGVAANKRLREKFNETMKQFSNLAIKLFIPPVSLCTDNAAAIASTAYFNYQPVSWEKIKANPSLSLA